ncbi:hypothetical protein [Staphylospora marina]|uniref:hypothetical protein n=1 Tax=Staphylospora marina TaxID=2490858 RepID=UPI000F5C1D4D|nr:hypothetical protein [Staphylospora marina]
MQVVDSVWWYGVCGHSGEEQAFWQTEEPRCPVCGAPGNRIEYRITLGPDGEVPGKDLPIQGSLFEE